MNILIMGLCIFDLEGAFRRRHESLYPERKASQSGKRHSEYPREELMAVLESPNFFQSVQPFPKAVEAVREMVELGHDVRVCSTLTENPEATVQSIELFIAHFGGEFFVNRSMVSQDRTIIVGDVLISDDLQIGREENPSWELVLLDTEYNKDILDKRRFTWDNWREVIPKVSLEKAKMVIKVSERRFIESQLIKEVLIEELRKIPGVESVEIEELATMDGYSTIIVAYETTDDGKIAHRSVDSFVSSHLMRTMPG